MKRVHHFAVCVIELVRVYQEHAPYVSNDIEARNAMIAVVDSLKELCDQQKDVLLTFREQYHETERR